LRDAPFEPACHPKKLLRSAQTTQVPQVHPAVLSTGKEGNMACSAAAAKQVFPVFLKVATATFPWQAMSWLSASEFDLQQNAQLYKHDSSMRISS
jgi:hypothetical protein